MTWIGQFSSLEATFQEALRHLRDGDFQAAIAGLREILEEEPTRAPAWHFLGVAYLQDGDPAEAMEAIQCAISLDGTKSVFHNNLGVTFLAQGVLAEAKQAFVNAVGLDPRYADAIANLGLVHSKLGNMDDAARLYRQALRIQPRHVDALFNLANLLSDQGKTTEAIGLYQKALEVQNARGDILNNLGRALLDNGQADQATACFRRALAVDPRCGEAAFNAGKAYAQQENIQEAEQAFETASRLRPTKSLWRHQRLGLCPTVFQSVAELDDYRAELDRRLDEAMQTPLRIDIDELAWDGFVPSFNLAHHGRSNRRLLEKFAALFTPHIPAVLPSRHLRGSSLTNGKKRVGFVVTAPHVGSFLRMQAGIVEHLDPNRFDVAVLCADSGMAKLRAGIHRHDVTWVPFSRRFSEAVKTIAEAACDVLYFHKVSSDPFGYLLPFARLAPVQCTAWTTHFTSGVPEVDFYLSSSFLEAPEADKEYTEQLVRFDASPCFEKRPGPIAPSSRADFGLPAQGSLYLCPQRLAKFHPSQDGLFCRILDEDSTATLVMLAGNNKAVLNHLLVRLRKTLGKAADRIVVLPPQSSIRLRQLMSVCDALLDIHHYSASLMAYDAFAVGLPIVTLPGQFKVERYTLGFYGEMGIHDLLAASPEEYMRLAIRLGKDVDFRQYIQKRIRSVSHQLFENRQSVIEFERFIQGAQGRLTRPGVALRVC